MGLDMYVYRISKPYLEDRLYEANQLLDQGMMIIAPTDAPQAPSTRELLPFSQELLVRNTYYDMEKVQRVYHFEDMPAPYGFASDGTIMVCGQENGAGKSISISGIDVKAKFLKTVEEVCFVCTVTQVAYWRNEYELQELFETLLTHVENNGYYMLDLDIIRAVNKFPIEDSTQLPEEEPTEASSLFYRAWY